MEKLKEEFDLRLVVQPGSQTDNNLAGIRGCVKTEQRPGLLVSYVYLRDFEKNRSAYGYRDWVLDSGAFSAWNMGKPVVLEQYIEKCQELLASDDPPTEIFSLDVINDWRAGHKNLEAMWAAGVPAIPTYHRGEPWDVLVGLAKDYDKIALGGMVGMAKNLKTKFAGECFGRVWPKKIHGFGCGGEDLVLAYPWHSVDASNWELAPCAFGQWKSFGKMSVRGGAQDLRAEIEWYLKLEDRARKKWAKVWEQVEFPKAPDVRLSVAPTKPTRGNGPDVRLAMRSTGREMK